MLSQRAPRSCAPDPSTNLVWSASVSRKAMRWENRSRNVATSLRGSCKAATTHTPTARPCESRTDSELLISFRSFWSGMYAVKGAGCRRRQRPTYPPLRAWRPSTAAADRTGEVGWTLGASPRSEAPAGIRVQVSNTTVSACDASVMTPERTQASVRMRADGDSIAQIVAQFGVGASSVSRALAKQDDETPVTS